MPWYTVWRGHMIQKHRVVLNWFEWERSGWRSIADVSAKSAQMQSVKCTKTLTHNGVCESIAAAEEKWWRRWLFPNEAVREVRTECCSASDDLISCVRLTRLLSLVRMKEQSPTWCMPWCMSRSKVRGRISVLQRKIPTSHPHTRRTVAGMLPCSDQLSRNPFSVQCRCVITA